MKENSNLYLPIEWWSKMIAAADKKVATISGDTGYGSVKIEIVIRSGEIKDLVITEEIRMRQKD